MIESRSALRHRRRLTLMIAALALVLIGSPLDRCSAERKPVPERDPPGKREVNTERGDPSGNVAGGLERE